MTPFCVCLNFFFFCVLKLAGADVIILQNLIVRSPYVSPIAFDGQYGDETGQAVSQFRVGNGMSKSTYFDSEVALLLLKLHSQDGYKDDGTIPPGYLYKLYVPVRLNRSIETTASLFDSKMNLLHNFTVRTHGQNIDGTDVALNMFSSDGVTPTGLAEFDLNSPEDDPKSFGPYPVNRFVRGLKGNCGIFANYESPGTDNTTLISDIRDGILLHTGGMFLLFLS